MNRTKLFSILICTHVYFAYASPLLAAPSKKTTLIQKAKEIVRSSMQNQIRGVVTTTRGETITIQNNKKTVQVQTSDQTDIRRKNGDAGSRQEIKKFDEIVVIGRQRKDNPSEITASYIRQLSTSPTSTSPRKKGR